jgi:hypothetical protein
LFAKTKIVTLAAELLPEFCNFPPYTLINFRLSLGSLQFSAPFPELAFPGGEFFGSAEEVSRFGKQIPGSR